MNFKDYLRKIIIIALGILLIIPIIITILAFFKGLIKEEADSVVLMIRGQIWIISLLRPLYLHIGIVLLLLFILYRINSNWGKYNISKRMIITAAITGLIILSTVIQLGYYLYLFADFDRVKKSDLNINFMFFYILGFVFMVFHNIITRDKRTELSRNRCLIKNTLSGIYCVPAIVFIGCVIMEVAAIVGTFGLFLKIWYDIIAFFEGPFKLFHKLYPITFIMILLFLVVNNYKKACDEESF